MILDYKSKILLSTCIRYNPSFSLRKNDTSNDGTLNIGPCNLCSEKDLDSDFKPWMKYGSKHSLQTSSSG